MKENFTKFKLSLLFVMIYFSSNMMGQATMDLVIDAPASIAGRYTMLTGGFGPRPFQQVTAGLPMVYTNPPLACTAILNDVKGKLAFIDRGTCLFYDKAKAAQLAGAVATLVCNNNPTTLPGLGSAADTLSSNAYLLTLADCSKIKVELAKGTVSAKIVNTLCNPVISTVKNAIWGTKPGEGDFNGGIGAWKIETPAGKGWAWDQFGYLGRGQYAGGIYIGSNTGCNGAMVFDSDYLDTNGKAEGTGTCLGGSCSSAFTSPNIDLSGFSDLKGLTVQFTQTYRQYLSTFYVLASYDNGATFDSIQINTNAVLNANPTINEVIKVGLCGADLSKKQVKIRFAMDGNYYYWGIDDVFLINDSGSDVEVQNFYSSSFTYNTPVSQAYEFPLVSDVKNNGPVSAPNVVLTASIQKNTSGNVYGSAITTEKNTFNTIDGCTIVENKLFANPAKHPTSTGLYRIKYDIATSGADSLPNNNSREAFFRMTDNVYGNSLNEVEAGSAYLSSLSVITNPAFIEQNDMSTGQYYFFPKGKGFKATRMYFGVNDNNTQTGDFASIVRMEVYKVKPGGTSNTIPESQLTLVGKGYDPANPENDDMFIDTATVGRRRTFFNVKDLDNKTLFLEDNTGYIFLLRTTFVKGAPANANTQVHIFPFLGFGEDSQTNFNSNAVTFANNTLAKKEWNYGSILNNGANLIGNTSVRTYNELIIAPNSVGTEEELAETNFSVYPNPATSDLFVDLKLTNVAKNVSVKITDIMGRIVLEQSAVNVQNETIKINIAQIPSGVYLTKIETSEGSTTKKIIISH
jgi:hypothetical protein